MAHPTKVEGCRVSHVLDKVKRQNLFILQVYSSAFRGDDPKPFVQ